MDHLLRERRYRVQENQQLRILRRVLRKAALTLSEARFFGIVQTQQTIY